MTSVSEEEIGRLRGALTGLLLDIRNGNLESRFGLSLDAALDVTEVGESALDL